MTPIDLILWACAILVAVIILMVPTMIVMMLVIEFRKRWRAVSDRPTITPYTDRKERFKSNAP